MKETILWPKTRIAAVHESHDALSVRLDNGRTFPVDAIILATGYRVQIDRVPFLARGNILDRLITHNGFPKLDEHFQTNIPGLFITSMPATQDFGPFFGFTYGVGTSAKVIGGLSRVGEEGKPCERHIRFCLWISRFDYVG